jgi:hemoglobin-like flavoprotein
LAVRDELIIESLDLAAERVEDMSPLVYARLFAAHPNMQPLFWRDTNNAVKGEMLAQAISAILDLVGPRRYGAVLLQCEVITHAGYDVPPDVFAVFFHVFRATLEDVVAEAWTPEMGEAWDDLLAEISNCIAHPYAEIRTND